MPEKFTQKQELKIPDLFMDIKIPEEKLGVLGVTIKGSTFLFTKQTSVYEKKGNKLEILQTRPRGGTIEIDFSKKSNRSSGYMVPDYVSLEISKLSADGLSKECFKLLLKYPGNSERTLYIT